MTDLQRQVSARVSTFVEEITELARQSAYEMLSGALEQKPAESGTAQRAAPTRSRASSQSRRKGAKRTSEELAEMANEFLDYVGKNPGQRMEAIAKALGYSTQELTLPVKKLSATGKLHVEGQKRATSYFLADDSASSTSKSGRGKGRRRRRRRS